MDTFAKLVQLQFKNEVERDVVFSVSPRVRAQLLVQAILQTPGEDLAKRSLDIEVRPGPKVDTAHDQYLKLNEETGRWEVIGTHKKTGDPFSISAGEADGLVKARHLARRAYPEFRPRYKKGDRIWYSADGKTRASITLSKDMSFICSIGYTDDGQIIQARRILGPVYKEEGAK